MAEIAHYECEVHLCKPYNSLIMFLLSRDLAVCRHNGNHLQIAFMYYLLTESSFALKVTKTSHGMLLNPMTLLRSEAKLALPH